ncbi:hypothetical protein N7474_003021 [Penicillium riverlandense]|uniref:uncharacterized protein n=1 Tax=Penicillium riverlandense TaxID=1903569 RepID=UPI0025477BB3|nr:uncharacterized protein N7474_003021 [Penicillium riverlandense]KAJ5825883.1 hypothetical protein N7474_003021 [Penicillium riverlandense]
MDEHETNHHNHFILLVLLRRSLATGPSDQVASRTTDPTQIILRVPACGSGTESHDQRRDELWLETWHADDDWGYEDDGRGLTSEKYGLVA